MNIVQTGPDSWRLDIRVWRDCKELRRREDFQGNKRQAKARADEVAKELRERGSLTVHDFSTFNEVLDFYKANHDTAKARADSYYKRLRAIGDAPIDRLSKVFKEFLRLEQSATSKRTGRPLTAAATNKLIVVASAALNYAAQQERIKENPIAGISKKREARRWVSLTTAQSAALVTATADVAPDLLPFVEYSFDVPCRKGEMLRAGRECYDSFSNTITLPGSLTKNGRPCTKPVPQPLTPYFRSNPSPWLFYRAKADGTYTPLGYIQKRWARIVKAAGLHDLRDGEGKSIGPLRPHDLRHVAVARLIAAGNPRSYVQHVAGWACDMLSTYWNAPDLEVAQGIIFREKPDSKPDSLKVVSA